MRSWNHSVCIVATLVAEMVDCVDCAEEESVMMMSVVAITLPCTAVHRMSCTPLKLRFHRACTNAVLSKSAMLP